jgi:hypothetical protein
MMTTKSSDISIGLTKLRLRPGDMLLVSVPERWSDCQIREFESNFRKVHGAALSYRRILVTA